MIFGILSGIAIICTMCCIIKFLYYYSNDWNFLKSCKRAKGTILRWVPTSSSSQSYKSSWWSSSSDWSPVIEYYDYDAGAVQQHEAILPKGCNLNQYDNPEDIEVEYKGRTVRISDKRYVPGRAYDGSLYALIGAIAFVVGFVCIILCVL